MTYEHHGPYVYLTFDFSTVVGCLRVVILPLNRALYVTGKARIEDEVELALRMITEMRARNAAVKQQRRQDPGLE